VPTIVAKTPKTNEFRKTRDAWAAGQGGRLRKAWGQLGGFAASEEDKTEAAKARNRLLAWGRRREINEAANVETRGTGHVEFRTKSGRTVLGKEALQVEGIAEALDAVTDPFMVAAIREADRTTAAAASEIWRDWPVYSGASKSALSLVWGQASAGIEIRFISGAEYTLMGHTRRAWQAAKKRWSEVPVQIGEAIKVARI